MPTKKQLQQIEIRYYTMTERTLHFTGEEARSWCVQLAICLPLRLVCMRMQIQECLLVLRKQLKGLKDLNKEIGSCAVDTDVVVLVIPVVQQL